MHSALLPVTTHVWTALVAAQTQKHAPVSPEDIPDMTFFEWFESNTHLLYPLIGMVALGLLIIGVFQAWLSPSLDFKEKAMLRREVMRSLRLEMGGLSAEQMARQLGVEPLKLVRVLEEMQTDGLVSSHTNTQRLTTWHIKGSEKLRRG